MNDANVHIQQRKPKTRVQSVLPMVVGGTTHYTLPYVIPQQGKEVTKELHFRLHV